MSQFVETAPETLEEWNAILSNGCCCTMPSCPVPDKECQSSSGSITPAGFYDPDVGNWSASLDALLYSGSYGVSYDQNYDMIVGGALCVTSYATSSGEYDPEATPYTGGVSRSTWMSSAYSHLAAVTLWGSPECLGDFCTASVSQSESLLGMIKSRFRWVIPNTFEGNYFKITWDVVFFPTTGDPSAVTTDNTWEWTGPGDPEDADSWKSGWYEIPVPTDPGESRVVNVRFECYHGAKFGVLPQVTGESVDLPPP